MSDTYVQPGALVMVSQELLDDSLGLNDYLMASMRAAAEEMRLTFLYGPRLGPGRMEYDRYRKRRRTIRAYRHRDRRYEDRWD